MKNNFWMKVAGATSTVAILTAVAIAAPPPADTRIGNQAAATFESNGQTFTVQSNLVETIVNEVFAVELTNDQTKSGAPGGIVTFPHTITNNGNTDDIFTLLTDAAGGTDDFALVNIVIYPDADLDGVADSLTPITVSPSILAGESYGVVVQATIPGNATATQVTDFTLTATSQNDAGVTQLNTDIIQITSDGVIDVQKDQILSVDADGDGLYSVGDTVEVTLNYANTGIAAATGIIITDDLPVTDTAGNPITLTYANGSGEWSDNPGVALTEAGDGGEFTNNQGTSIDYEYDGTSLITTRFDTLAPGRSGAVTFSYVITAAEVGTFENFATFESDTQAPTLSNTSPVTISPTAEFVLADALALAATPVAGIDGANLDGGDASVTDDDAATDDVVTDSDDVYLGQTTAFDFVLTNLGNAADFFDLTVANTDFPAGTTFTIVDADGVTPLIGNEIFVSANSSRHLQVVARFPSDAAAAAASPANFDAVLTATSQADPTTSNTSTLSFTGALVAPPVDLENLDAAGNPAGGAGNGAVDNGGDPWNTVSLLPGETATFPLRITVAAGAPTNSFDLTGSTDGTFAALTLPPGWSLQFFDLSGTQITSTGAMTPTAGAPAVFDYEARVTIPSNAAPIATPGQGIFFRAESPLNGASDTKLDAVIVEQVIDLSIETDQQVQAAPGGVVVIPHTITNLGNETITAGTLTIGGVDPFDNGITSSLYYDINNNGVLDAADTLISNITDIAGGIAPGDSVQVFVRAQTPAGSTFGLSETGDVTIGDQLTAGGVALPDADTTNNTVLDTITIITGDLVVDKQAAIDTNCDGTAETAFSIAPQNADPSDCIVYQITADNTGSSIAEDVILSDATPIYTSIETCGGACPAVLDVDGTTSAPGVVPADEATGSISSAAAGVGFSLDPGARAELTFTVQIDE